MESRGLMINLQNLLVIVGMLVSSVGSLSLRIVESTTSRMLLDQRNNPFNRCYLSSKRKEHQIGSTLLRSLPGVIPEVFDTNKNYTSILSSNLKSSVKVSPSLPRASSLRIPLLASKTATTSKKKDLKTFPRYLEVECWKRQELRSLEPVLQAFADSCQQITRIVQRAQTDDVYGVADTGGIENIQGEIQQKLDVLCNTIMMRTFCGSSSDTILAVASEEEEVPRCCSDVMV